MPLPDKVTYVVEGEFKKVRGGKRKNRRILRWRGSTDAIDRDGDVIPVDGWDTDNYLKNPVVLFGHDYHMLPVGRALSVTISEDGLDFDLEFPSSEEEAGEHFKFADSVYRLAANRFLNAASVGFRPLEEAKILEDGDGVKNPRRQWGRRELLELSIVPVPSNPGALRRAFHDGALDPGEDVPFLRKVMAESTYGTKNISWAETVDKILDEQQIDEPPSEDAESIPDSPLPRLLDLHTKQMSRLYRRLGDVGTKVERMHATLSLSIPDHGTVETSGGPGPHDDLSDWVGKQLASINDPEKDEAHARS